MFIYVNDTAHTIEQLSNFRHNCCLILDIILGLKLSLMLKIEFTFGSYYKKSICALVLSLEKQIFQSMSNFLILVLACVTAVSE